MSERFFRELIFWKGVPGCNWTCLVYFPLLRDATSSSLEDEAPHSYLCQEDSLSLGLCAYEVRLEPAGEAPATHSDSYLLPPMCHLVKFFQFSNYSH